MTNHKVQPGRPFETMQGNESSSWRNELSGTVQGSAVQAQNIHGGVHVHTAGPAPVPPPAQLPPPPANFTGRAQELAMLDEHALAQEPGRVTLLVLMGVGGVGKTALALHWLHRISSRYTGGALYADLGGHIPGAARPPGEILTSFLRALDVPAEQIPLSLSEQAALFRSVTSRCRLIVLLDNPASAAQVRTLLPGSPPAPETAGEEPGADQHLTERSSLVLVTTRRRITGLAIDGGRFVELGPLSEDAAVELLGRMVGPTRVTREPDAVHRVVRMCNHLPIAVCVCAARLAPHPQWGIGRIADELASEHDRLAALSLAGDISVRAVFDVSYKNLARQAARVYRLTSLLPGPGFGPDLVAAATGMDLRHTGQLLDALADASLLEETGDRRYRFHDLIRLHAREHARSHPAREQHSVITRAVTWYLQQAVAVDLVIMPYRWRLNPMYQEHSTPPSAYSGPAQALDAQEASLPGVLAAIRTASDQGLHELAWQLCEAMWGLFMHRKLVRPWITSHLLGLATAQACGNQRAQARMSVQLGAAYLTMGRRDDARDLFATALELERQTDHRIGVATALEQLGRSELADGHPDQAISYFTEARDIFHELGRPRAIALMGRCIGDALIAAARPDQAISELLQASAEFAALPDPFMHARALTVLAQAYLAAGQLRQAMPPLEEALATMTGLDIPYEQGRIYDALAEAARQLDEPDRERAYLDRARAAYAQTSVPITDAK